MRDILVGDHHGNDADQQRLRDSCYQHKKVSRGHAIERSCNLPTHTDGFSGVGCAKQGLS